jgi:uncharacterized UBP type Zn finger protein
VTDPTPLRVAMKENIDIFNNNLQQDAHEFLVQLICLLQNEFKMWALPSVTRIDSWSALPCAQTFYSEVSTVVSTHL